MAPFLQCRRLFRYMGIKNRKQTPYFNFLSCSAKNKGKGFTPVIQALAFSATTEDFLLGGKVIYVQ